MRVFLVVALLLLAVLIFAAVAIVIHYRGVARTRKSETPLLGVVAPRPGGVVHRDHPDLVTSMTPADRELLRKLLDEGDDHVA